MTIRKDNMKPKDNMNHHRYQMLSVLGAATLLLFASTACLPGRATAPLPTLPATSTPVPTATATATWTPAPRPTATPTPTPTLSYPITNATTDEIIEVGDLVMTVTWVTRPAPDHDPESQPTPTLGWPQAGEPAPAPAPTPTPDPDAKTGRRLVLLELNIRNVGERVVGINSARDLVLKDGTNQVYRISATALATIGGTPHDVDLAPGEIIRAQAGFDIPITASDLVLSFAADRFGAGRIAIRLP